MANEYVNKVVLSSGETLIDLSGDTADAAHVLKGSTFHDKSGAPKTGTCTYDSDTSEDTVAVSEILVGKTAHARGVKITGTMPNNGAVSGNIATKDGQYTVPQGFHDGSGKVGIASAEKEKLIPGNIKSGVEVLGVTGSYSGEGTPQLCGQVENFKAGLGNLSVILSWTAPSPDEDNSFVGARIVRKTGSAPTGINDGTVVYEGTALTYTDTGLTAGTTYYYRAFAYNAKKKYQTEYRVISITAMAIQPIQPNFADNTWDAIIEACHSGNVPDTWVAGDSKTMTIGGKSYQFDIVGKNHDTYTAGGIAPLTFGLHDCYGTKYPMNSSNTNSTGWDGSKMRTETLAAILAKMPVNIQNGIRAVNKLTATSGSDSAIKTASDKLFTFSEMEVYGITKKSHAGEGKQYDYFKAGNSKVKKVGSTASWWWLRSPNMNNSSYFCTVDTKGSVGIGSSSSSQGVCFGFCF